MNNQVCTYYTACKKLIFYAKHQFQLQFNLGQKEITLKKKVNTKIIT